MTHRPAPAPATPTDLLEYLEEHRRNGQVPGLSVAVVHRDPQVFAHAWGHADLGSGRAFTVDTACHWFSMTKIVTVTAAMHLVDEGRLDLDAPVESYLPGVLPPAYREVRVVHLAQHSAGLRNPLPLRWVHRSGQPIPDQRDFLARHLRRGTKPRAAPGTRARYSNLSTVVLGEVLAAITRRPYADYVREAVLVPLDMGHTAFTDDAVGDVPRAVGYVRITRALDPLLRAYFPTGIVGDRARAYLGFAPFEMDAPACSGLIGPVTDAVQFLAVHLAENSLLSRESAARMQHVTMPGKPYDLGLGWFRPVARRGALGGALRRGWWILEPAARRPRTRVGRGRHGQHDAPVGRRRGRGRGRRDRVEQVKDVKQVGRRIGG